MCSGKTNIAMCDSFDGDAASGNFQRGVCDGRYGKCSSADEPLLVGNTSGTIFTIDIDRRQCVVTINRKFETGAALSRRPRSPIMPRHAHYLPHGVIPAVLLPFNDDLSIDEKSFRSHLRDVAATKGISAITS
jgi:hypothetical protein